ncbi:MAG TPA: lipase [Myxococcales bacterium]|nr:lipase [Myxococcales bacterium]
MLLLLPLVFAVAGCGGGAANISVLAADVGAQDSDPSLQSDALGDAPVGMSPDTSDNTDAGDVTVADTFDEDLDSGDAMVGASDCQATLKGAPYPIVLVHGFFGTDKFAGLDFATYFYEIKADLAKQGETEVFTPALDPFNSSDKRAGELLAKIKTIMTKTGRAKVNLVGHSQGGLDARLLASEHPDLVASVITLATPHKGTMVADIAMKLLPNDAAKGVVDALAKIIGVPLYGKDGAKSSASTSIEQFTTAAMDAFEAKYPDRKGVARYSLAGRSGLMPHMKICKPDEAHDFVVKLQSSVDPIDALFVLTESLLDGTILSPKPNDGLVRVEDAKWGTFLGCVPADHIDQVGHLFGDKPGIFNPFNHKKMFRWLVSMLRLKGY